MLLSNREPGIYEWLSINHYNNNDTLKLLFVGSTDMNWHLLIMLESALKASPSNHHFKLLLMKVYCSMGKFVQDFFENWKIYTV